MGFAEDRIKYAPFRERIIPAEQAAMEISDGMTVAIPDQFVTHGNVDYLYRELGMDEQSVTERILNRWYGK